MFLFTYTAAILTVLSVGIAVFLFVKGKKDPLTHVLILYILADALWIGGNAAADISTSPTPLIIWSGIAFTASAFIVTFFLIFVDTFVDGRLPSFQRLVFYALPSALFAIFSFSDYAILGTAFPEGEPAQIIPGVQYYFYLVFLFGGLLYVLSRLLRLFKKATGERKLQTLYITIGFLALFFGGVTFGIILPLLGELRFFNVAPQFSVILAITTAYAILKHKLFDIRIVVQRGIIYSLLFAFIVSFYLSIITLTSFFLQQMTLTAIMVNAGITTVLGIFSVPHIDRYLRKKTDRFFFKDTYNYADALYELSEKIHKSVLLKDIQQLTEETLGRILKTTLVRVEFVNENELDQFNDDTKNEKRVTLNVPIIFEGNAIGGIFMGTKKSGDPYTDEDLVLIRTFSHQIASAFQKARLYSEVQAYSKDLEARVAQRTQQIRDMQDHQAQILLDISHKLQSPLTVVKSQLALLRKHLPQDDTFNLFERTIDDISAFVYDLLHLAQLENAGEKIVAKKKCNLSDLLQELVEYFEVMAQHQGIAFEKNIERNIFFSCDVPQIRELLTNLVSNAVKYSDPKKSKPFISLSLSMKDDAIQIQITDNGLGIDTTDLPHIFERFYRTHTTSSIKGTGLGLAISKKIVELHNGTITAAKNEHGDTTFVIRFLTSPDRNL